jgi:hypothetical protein
MVRLKGAGHKGAGQAKKDAALKTESHGKVLMQIAKMAKDAGLILAEITHAYESQKTKPIPTLKTPSKKSSRAKSHTMKGVNYMPNTRTHLILCKLGPVEALILLG